MTIQNAVNTASLRVVGTVPSAVFSSTDQVIVEMRDLAQDVAEDIARSHDWRDLTRIAEFNGDGATVAFPKPADYDRMLVTADVRDKNAWFWDYYEFPTVSEFMLARSAGFQMLSPGGWIILDGQFQFTPAPTGIANFPYISRNFVAAQDGTRKASFTEDSDTFLLDEGILSLGLIWRYRAQKGLDYSEDMASYELRLSQAQSRDAGAQTITSRRRFVRGRFSVPYHGTVV